MQARVDDLRPLSNSRDGGIMPPTQLFTHVPHARIAARRQQRPPQRSDMHSGFNGRLAAWMTRGVGSMWVVYVTTTFVLAWMFLAQLGALGFDRYPFPFLLFLGNVVQLLLVFVILVGQQVLGATAERRAVQTYEDAEAILHEVRQLRAHLVAQDTLLSTGIGLCDAASPPLVEEAQEAEPPSSSTTPIGVNGRIGAYLTQKVGTMGAFYSAAVFQFGWIALAWAGVIRFDPYPFAFLLFLSSLTQLILMVVIMVGQQVLGAAGDERAIKTYGDAEAVLQECVRLQAHLTAQDQTIVAIVAHLQRRAAPRATLPHM